MLLIIFGKNIDVHKHSHTQTSINVIIVIFKQPARINLITNYENKNKGIESPKKTTIQQQICCLLINIVVVVKYRKGTNKKITRVRIF